MRRGGGVGGGGEADVISHLHSDDDGDDDYDARSGHSAANTIEVRMLGRATPRPPRSK